MLRLTDKEKAEIYNQVLVEGGLDYAPSGDLQDRTGKAQLKKVVEYIFDKGDIVAELSGEDGTTRLLQRKDLLGEFVENPDSIPRYFELRIELKELQALLEEVK